MAWCVDRPDVDAIHAKHLAITKAGAQAFGLCHLAHRGDTAGLFTQLSQTGDVIGMDVRVHCEYQAQVEFVGQLDIAVGVLQHRVDEQGTGADSSGRSFAFCLTDVAALTRDVEVDGLVEASKPRKGRLFHGASRSRLGC